VYGIKVELDAVELSGRVRVVLLSGGLLMVIVAFMVIADGGPAFQVDGCSATLLVRSDHLVSVAQLRSCSLLCTSTEIGNATVLHK